MAQNTCKDYLRWQRIHLQCRRPGVDPWVEKIPWRKECNQLQCSRLENPHEQRTLFGYNPWGHKELDTTEQLSTNFYTAHKLLWVPTMYTLICQALQWFKEVFDDSKKCKMLAVLVIFCLPLQIHSQPSLPCSVLLETVWNVSQDFFALWFPIGSDKWRDSVID